MTAYTAQNAETFLLNLKYHLEEVWELYVEDKSLEKLAYAKDHYGVMQREELKGILQAFAGLKVRIDDLLTDCATIPADQRVCLFGSRRPRKTEEDYELN